MTDNNKTNRLKYVLEKNIASNIFIKIISNKSSQNLTFLMANFEGSIFKNSPNIPFLFGTNKYIKMKNKPIKPITVITSELIQFSKTRPSPIIINKYKNTGIIFFFGLTTLYCFTKNLINWNIGINTTKVIRIHLHKFHKTIHLTF